MHTVCKSLSCELNADVFRYETMKPAVLWAADW